MNEIKGKKKRKISLGKKRADREKRSRSEVTVVDQYDVEAYKSDEACRERSERKLLRKTKRNRDKIKESENGKVDELENYVKDGFDEQTGVREQGEKKDRKLRKKGRRSEKIKKVEIDKVNVLYNEVEDGIKKENGKSRKARKSKKKDHLSSTKEEKLLGKSEPEQNEVHEISSGDEDCSRGMKKWITEYHQSRPGLKILQQRIDDFMTAYEEQEEQARKEKEALAADGGWTVVVHHKGRKKTIDEETGITVGSVSQAAARENKDKKKSKGVGLDFYRFQKREAHRSEVMALQSKFEQDKKRIQQLRAARKFRPY